MNTRKIKIFGFAFWLAAWCGNFLYAQAFFEVTPLSVNTESKEMAPAFYENGLVFCSDRRNEWFISYTDYKNNPLTNLYWTEQKRPGKFENPQLFSRDLTSHLFEGPATFSMDGKTIYLTRNISSGSRNRQSSDTTLGIFSAIRTNGEWTGLQPFPFNSQEYNTGYPCLSPDGNTLYFCSNDPKGFGGYDIYVSHLENGNWGQPVNLGSTVNTAGNEVFPFIHESGRLYFASRGYNTQGDLDILYSENINGAWTDPVLLPEPFNSGSDDYGLIMNTAMDTGYFVSDRMNSADIYMASSTLPTFTDCPSQQKNEYCYIFYESNNADIDTSALAYEWDLGDGTRIRALKGEHCYAEPGTYHVELNVIDKLTGETYFSQASYTLSVEMIEQAYISAPDSAQAGEPISFNGNESYFKDFEAAAYYWDFGDGERATSMETDHAYIRPGIYTVQLGLTGSGTDEKRCVTRKIVVK